MKTTYAKTPWKICYDGQIDSSDGQFICSFRWESFNEFEKRGQDAAFIVRAVNAHEELVEACATAAEDIRQFLDGEWNGSIEGWQETRERLLKSLAKARGES